MQITNTTVGNMQLVGQVRLNLKDEQPGTITFDGSYIVTLIFHPGQSPDQPEAKLSWTAQPNGVRIDAWGWVNSLGESLLDPVSIAKNNTNQKSVFINLINHKIGTLNSCNIDFYEG